VTAPAAARECLEGLWARGRAFLGCDVPIMGGAMTWVSERNLVAAITNAGGFGVIACGSMRPERLREEIRATRAMTAGPFGVNLIVMHPQLETLADVCLAEGVGFVVLAGGLPAAALVKKLKDAGAKVIAFAPELPIAR